MSLVDVDSPGGEDLSVTTMSDTCDLVGLPRLIHHVRENNVAYLLGLLIAYQFELFQFLQTQAGGMC